MTAFPHRADMVGSLLRPDRLSATPVRPGATATLAGRRAARRSRTSASPRLVAQRGGGRHRRGHRRRVPSRLVAPRLPRRVRRHRPPPSASGRPTSTARARARRSRVVIGKVRHDHPIFVDAFTYLASVDHHGIPKITIPGPGNGQLMGGRKVIDDDDVSRHRGVLGRSRRGLSRRGRRAVRRRLPLPAARRRQLRLPVRPRLPRADDGARRRSRRDDHPLPRCDERRHRRPPRRPVRVDAHVPRQLPQPVGGERWLRADRRARSSAGSTSTPSSSSSTASERAGSSRCATSPPARPWCSVSSRRRPPELGEPRRPPHRIDEASQSCRSTSWRSARSAGSPARTTATISPRTTSGASSSSSSRSPHDVWG